MIVDFVDGYYAVSDDTGAWFLIGPTHVRLGIFPTLEEARHKAEELAEKRRRVLS